MDTTKKSSVALLAFSLVFFIIASDMCMKCEARGPIVHIHCAKDEDCVYRPCAKCGCKCIKTYCECPRPNFSESIYTHAPTN
ncbi:hypothetical protein VNO80_26353 [Phaseolus coccineus]|uniref:Uncharacterized protein n=1 Tax=Phaseolus coccineus TaxID=3886 RepID=A0AAN9QKE5_PHACN